MARRIVAAVVLALVGVWLFAPTSSSHPAAACSPTEPLPVTASPSPLPNITPPPATAAPSPPPATPTFTPEQRLSQLIQSSQVSVVGTIRTIDDAQVLIDVEAYTKTDQLTSTLGITTYRERFELVGGLCEPDWHRVEEQVVSLRLMGERAVFFLNSYYAGEGVAVVGRGSTILLLTDGQLHDIDSARPFGSADQLDTWFKPGAAPAQLPETAPPPAATPASRWQPWMLISAGLAAAGLALMALGLILKRSKQTKI
jgi:hypothetical protein